MVGTSACSGSAPLLLLLLLLLPTVRPCFKAKASLSLMLFTLGLSPHAAHTLALAIKAKSTTRFRLATSRQWQGWGWCTRRKEEGRGYSRQSTPYVLQLFGYRSRISHSAWDPARSWVIAGSASKVRGRYHAAITLVCYVSRRRRRQGGGAYMVC